MVSLRRQKENLFEEQQSGILIFKERRFAVGLTWLTSENENEASLIKDRARRLKADFYCVRSTIVNQQGFGHLHMGHRIAMPSAASIAAEIMVGEWHGIFAADNGWWYLAVHSDAIAPDGDRIFFSEEEAYNFFVQRAEEYKWPRSYAPAAWNLPDTNGDVPIDRLLEDPGSGSALKPTNLDAAFGGPKNKKAAIGAGFVFLTLAVMMALLPSMFSGIVNQEKQAIIPVSLDVAEEIKPPPPEPKNEEAQNITFTAVMLPVPSALLSRCLNLFDGIVHPVPGWKLDTVQCNASGASSSWQRESGGLENLQAAAGQFAPEAQRRFSGSNQFVVSLAMGSLQDIEKPARIVGRDEAVLALNERFEGIGQLQVKYVVPDPPKQPKAPPRGRGMADAAAAAPPPKAHPPFLQVNLSTESPPDRIAGYFDVPGLSLQSVSWNVTSRTWTYVAQILVDSEQLRTMQETPG